MPEDPTVVQWILDTRGWWPQATQTRQLESHVRENGPLPP